MMLRVNYLLLLSIAICEPTNTVGQALYEIPEGVETRWATPENPQAEKGKGAQISGGRKGAATIAIKAGARAVLAEALSTQVRSGTYG